MAAQGPTTIDKPNPLNHKFDEIQEFLSEYAEFLEKTNPMAASLLNRDDTIREILALRLQVEFLGTYADTLINTLAEFSSESWDPLPRAIQETIIDRIEANKEESE